MKINFIFIFVIVKIYWDCIRISAISVYGESRSLISSQQIFCFFNRYFVLNLSYFSKHNNSFCKYRFVSMYWRNYTTANKEKHLAVLIL